MGPDTIVSAEYIQSYSHSDCFYTSKGVTPDMTTGVEVPFEKIRLTYDPTLGDVGSA
jgi:hypothetical protein